MPSDDYRLITNHKIDYRNIFHLNWTGHMGDDMEQILAGIANYLVEVYNSTQLDSIYPVGSIYMSTNSTDPQQLFGGLWEPIEGRFLVGAGSSYSGGSTGGSTSAEVGIDVDTSGGLASHSHGFSYSSASSVNTQRLRYVGWTDDYQGTQQWAAGIDCFTTYVPSRSSSGSISLNTSTRSSTTNSAGSGSGGGSGSGSDTVQIVPPYLAVYMWERIE